MELEYKLIACELKHKALLAELGGSTFYEAFAAHQSKEDMDEYVGKTYAISAIEKNLLNAEVIYYAAYNSEMDLGYIKLLENKSANKLNGRVMELEKIYVRQAAHGSKVASFLMQKAIDLAVEKKYQYLYLGVWQNNERALAFYKKFGFKVFDTPQLSIGRNPL
jgi:ribosomal protein S18 acetylase RimI-like enzyme